MNRGIIQLTRALPLVQSQCHLKRIASPKLFTSFFKKGVQEPLAPPDPIENAVGPLKAQFVLAEMGIADPFLMQPVHNDGNGMTKDNPHLVLIFKQLDSRIIACQCETDQTYVNYMWVDKGECKRCECGIWFKGVEIPHPYEYVPKMI